MHGEVLAGPLWLVTVGVLLLTAALALFVVIQSVRPKHQAAAERLPEPLWLYTVTQGFFVALLVFTQLVPFAPASLLLVVLVPGSLIISFAFMLRVLWPRVDASAEADAGGARRGRRSRRPDDNAAPDDAAPEPRDDLFDDTD